MPDEDDPKAEMPAPEPPPPEPDDDDWKPFPRRRRFRGGIVSRVDDGKRRVNDVPPGGDD